MILAGKPFELDRECYEQIKFISPNLNELRKIAETLKCSPAGEGHSQLENVKTADDEREISSEIVELCDKLQLIENIIVTAGSLGVFIQRRDGSEGPFFDNKLKYKSDGRSEKAIRHYPGKPIQKIVNASGAGDAFCAGFITGMLKHRPEAICISIGFHAAISALMSERAVPEAFFDMSHECWKTPAGFTRMKNDC
jgi:sugar/nucleoside kinase (ribokinase family)